MEWWSDGGADILSADKQASRLRNCRHQTRCLATRQPGRLRPDRLLRNFEISSRGDTA